MLLDLIDLPRLKRALRYALYMLLTLMLQNLVFSRITVLGVRAMFVPAAVVAAGMFGGGVTGALLGLLTGLLCDLTFGSTVLFAALLPVIGFFSGVLARYFVNVRFFAYMCVSFAALLLTALCQLFPLWVFLDQAPLPLFRTAALQVLWSLPVAALLYPPCKRLGALGSD